jgi:hypothetical protein
LLGLKDGYEVAADRPPLAAPFMAAGRSSARRMA